MDESKWKILSNCQQKLAAVEFNLVDRAYLLKEISRYKPKENSLYFWNLGYKVLQKVSTANGVELNRTDYTVAEREEVLSACQQVEESATIVLEGFGEIDDFLNHRLRNFFFDPAVRHQIILADEIVSVPLSLYSLIPVIKYNIPSLREIRNLLEEVSNQEVESTLVQAYFGLPRGEIELIWQSQDIKDTSSLVTKIRQYKSEKLVKQGLKIVPRPDINAVGGLDKLERDLNKIKRLFTMEAADRGLRPPKACCMWGLPGTGKSLVSKMMSYKLNATLVACDWNALLDVDLSSSLANLQRVLDIVDGIGNCVLFFDEFEKAFAGWSSGKNGGVLAKMAGKLLTWMQDHESPAVMLATINRLDMLPPELIRRFNYIWFFPSELHNGAMWEIFQLHLDKNFPGIQEQFSDSQWRMIFSRYLGCSPAEIATAVSRTHDEIFYKEIHHDLEPETLIKELIDEREQFEPAITNRSTSNALAEILSQADFARPVRGEDTSRFAVASKDLFEHKTRKRIGIDEYSGLFYKMTQAEAFEQ